MTRILKDVYVVSCIQIVKRMGHGVKKIVKKIFPEILRKQVLGLWLGNDFHTSTNAL
jgi:hypothetical protein